jgi:arsenate reductase
MNKPKVLFLCTGNSARSQMAEALLRASANDYFEAYSAGVEPKGYILPTVIDVMKEHGIDLGKQKSKDVREYLGKMHFAYVITLCADTEENCPTIFLNMGTHEHWPFDDPAEFKDNDAEQLEFTRKVRDQIEQRIRQWLTDQNIQPTLP